MRNFFYHLLNWLLSLLITAIGITIILIPWSSLLQSALVAFIEEYSTAMSLVGIALTTAGVCLIVHAIFNLKKRHYVVRSGKNAVIVDQSLIQQTLKRYWKEKFPNNEIPFFISIKRNKIHLSVDLPSHPLSQQKELLERIKSDLKELLENVLDYHDEFYLAATFC